MLNAMIVLALLTALHLIVLHDAEHRAIAINSDEISSLRTPGEGEADHYDKDIKCLVIMTNGRLIGVTESCQDVFLKTHEVR